MSADPSKPVTCPRCGSPLEGRSVLGLCARCLGALPLATETLMGPAGALEPLPPPTVEELAEFFPQLEILGYLGRGGMGVVYHARQRSLDRPVALKLLAPERAGDPAFARRFAREARSLAALNHPHIVAVYDSGEVGGYFYLLMEYVDGENLREVLRRRTLSPLEALELIGPVCEALERAHRRGIIHRDIKPENLLIDRMNVVKIADFGISRMLGDTVEEPGQGTVAIHAPTLAVGTPAYAAPEQLASAPLDPRADLYSLGVVLCEMLTGVRPDQVPLADVKARLPAKLRGIIAKTLQETPDARFANAAELGRSVALAREALRREPRQRKLRVAAAGGLLASVLAFSAIGLSTNRKGNDGGTPTVTGAVAKTGPPETVAEKPGEPSSRPAPESRDEALRQFELNFTALLETRRTMAVETPETAGERSALEEKLHELEARDHDLRAWIDAHPEEKEGPP